MKKYIEEKPLGEPICLAEIHRALAEQYRIPLREAAHAVSIAMKQIRAGNAIPEFRVYERWIYYRTVKSVFGEYPVDERVLIRDKYLSPDKGYDSGPMLI